MSQSLQPYDIKEMDPEFMEAYNKVNELHQRFMDRQCYIKKNESDDYKYHTEKEINAIVIRLIQWVKYHLWGNSDEVIVNKTKISQWQLHGTYFRPSAVYMYYSPFACHELGFDENCQADVTYSEIIKAILKVIIPQRSHSIFSIDDQVTESITLKQEIDRIYRKIQPHDSVF